MILEIIKVIAVVLIVAICGIVILAGMYINKIEFDERKKKNERNKNK